MGCPEESVTQQLEQLRAELRKAEQAAKRQEEVIAEEAERRAKEKKAFGEELERDAACQLKRMLCVHRVLVIHGSLQGFKVARCLHQMFNNYERHRMEQLAAELENALREAGLDAPGQMQSDTESYEQYMYRVNLLIERRKQLLSHLGGSERKRWEDMAHARVELRNSEANSTILEPKAEQTFGLRSPRLTSSPRVWGVQS